MPGGLFLFHSCFSALYFDQTFFLDNCRWEGFPYFLQELQDPQAEADAGIAINDKRLCSKEKVNLRHVSLKDVSLDRIYLEVKLLISIQKFKHYTLIWNVWMTLFFIELNPWALFLVLCMDFVVDDIWGGWNSLVAFFFFTLSHIIRKEGIDSIWRVVKQFTKSVISSSPVTFGFCIIKV